MARPDRRIVRSILLIAFPAAALLVGAHFYVSSLRYVTSENAYVKAKLVSVSPEVSGRVIEVAVQSNQPVKAGDTLFRIDPEPFRLAHDRAEAELAVMRNTIEAMRAEYRQAEAELAEARESITYNERNFRRQRTLSRRGVATEATFDQAENALAISRKRALALDERLGKLRAGLAGRPTIAVGQHPLYLNAMGKRDIARLDLRRTVVRAPVDGTVGTVALEPGEYVTPGQRTFPLVESRAPWIEANLKETQITDLRVGQAATIKIDAYPDWSWRGKVASVSPSTGAEFAILPPQNASGNWVKVVQRVPVRLEIEPADGAPQLRAGMTATISIDTERDHSLFHLVGGAAARRGAPEAKVK